MRCSIYLDDEFEKQISAEAKKLGISRSGYIKMACLEKIESDKARTTINDVATAFQKEAINIINDALQGKTITQKETEKRLNKAVKQKKK